MTPFETVVSVLAFCAWVLGHLLLVGWVYQSFVDQETPSKGVRVAPAKDKRNELDVWG